MSNKSEMTEAVLQQRGCIVRETVNGHLPVYPDDPDDAIIVKKDPGTGALVGWIRAGDAKEPEFYSDSPPGRFKGKPTPCLVMQPVTDAQPIAPASREFLNDEIPF
jgi:hypothetical protein